MPCSSGSRWCRCRCRAAPAKLSAWPCALVALDVDGRRCRWWLLPSALRKHPVLEESSGSTPSRGIEMACRTALTTEGFGRPRDVRREKHPPRAYKLTSPAPSSSPSILLQQFTFVQHPPSLGESEVHSLSAQVHPVSCQHAARCFPNGLGGLVRTCLSRCCQREACFVLPGDHSEPGQQHSDQGRGPEHW